MTSRGLGILQKAYRDLFGKEPRVYTIHAGLECGMRPAVVDSHSVVALLSILRVSLGFILAPAKFRAQSLLFGSVAPRQ